jgi:hypothetical protein
MHWITENCRFPAEAPWAATPSSAAVARGADVPMAATSAEVSVPLLGQAFQGLMVEPVVRSVFVGLSGLGDAFGSIGELCSTARRGVYLDPKMVPVFDLPANDADEPLNAYVLDFFKHGQVFLPLTCRPHSQEQGDSLHSHPESLERGDGISDLLYDMIR